MHNDNQAMDKHQVCLILRQKVERFESEEYFELYHNLQFSCNVEMKALKHMLKLKTVSSI